MKMKLLDVVVAMLIESFVGAKIMVAIYSCTW